MGSACTHHLQSTTATTTTTTATSHPEDHLELIQRTRRETAEREEQEQQQRQGPRQVGSVSEYASRIHGVVNPPLNPVHFASILYLDGDDPTPAEDMTVPTRPRRRPSGDDPLCYTHRHRQQQRRGFPLNSVTWSMRDPAAQQRTRLGVVTRSVRFEDVEDVFVDAEDYNRQRQEVEALMTPRSDHPPGLQQLSEEEQPLAALQPLLLPSPPAANSSCCSGDEEEEALLSEGEEQREGEAENKPFDPVAAVTLPEHVDRNQPTNNNNAEEDSKPPVALTPFPPLRGGRNDSLFSNNSSNNHLSDASLSHRHSVSSSSHNNNVTTFRRAIISEWVPHSMQRAPRVRRQS